MPPAGSLKPQQTLSVLVADDHPVVLRGLESLIATDPLFQVVQTCSDGSSALEAIGELQPALAVLDINMPEMTGLEVLARVAADRSPTKVILLTASVGDRQILRAIADGVYGLILKDAAAGTLLDCLHAVGRGDRWLPSDLVDPALQREGARNTTARGMAGTLTKREREIALHVAEGLSNKDIARRINVSDGTVKIHLHNIYQKLGVNNRTSLAALAIAYMRDGSV